MNFRHRFFSGIVIFLVLFAVLSQVSWVASWQNSAQDGPQVNSKAILFLLDESGGVSGRCKAPGEVLITDEEAEFRYEFVRLFWWIWKEFYSGDWVVGPRPTLPGLYLGIAQFAQDYQETFPFQSGAALIRIDDLLNSSDEQELNRRLLANSIQMLAPYAPDWTCHTDYAKALRKAGESLHEVPANERLLILVTDGSFRGYERENPTQVELDNVRDETEKALQQLVNSDIQVNVLLLSADRCRTAACSALTLDARTVRNIDLNLWDSWEHKGLIKLIDIHQPFQSLAENRVVASTLPNYAYSGWIEGEPVSFSLPGAQDKVRLVTVSSRQMVNGNLVQMEKDSNYAIVNTYFNGELQKIDYKYVPSLGNDGCPSSVWTLKSSNSDFVHYYWVAPCNNADMNTKLSDLKVNCAGCEIQGKEIFLDATQNTVSVQTSFDPESCPSRPQCYQVKFKVRSRQGGIDHPLAEATHNFDLSHLSQSTTFDIPNHLAWGSELIVSADLVYGMSPENMLVTSQKKFSVSHELNVIKSEIKILSVDAEGYVNILVPIEGAAMLPSGIRPVFSLYPDQFDSQKEPPPPPKGACATDEKAVADNVKENQEGNERTVNYEVQFHYADSWGGDCGYRELLVQVEIAGKPRLQQWVNLADITPTLTPTPTPPSDPVDDGHISPIVVVVIIFVVLLGFGIIFKNLM